MEVKPIMKINADTKNRHLIGTSVFVNLFNTQFMERKKLNQQNQSTPSTISVSTVLICKHL